MDTEYRQTKDNSGDHFMFKLIVTVALIALLKTVTAFGQEAQAGVHLGAEFAGRGDGTLPLGSHELEGSDGTLPLRLPADGTLPLKLTGNSGAMIGGVTVPTRIIISRAVQTAMDPVTANALNCQNQAARVSKHAAQGSIQVGDQNFALKGICFDHATNTMELVGERRGTGQAVIQSFLVGLLSAAEPQIFQGRLTISGQAPTAQRFTFNVRAL